MWEIRLVWCQRKYYKLVKVPRRNTLHFLAALQISKIKFDIVWSMQSNKKRDWTRKDT